MISLQSVSITALEKVLQHVAGGRRKNEITHFATITEVIGRRPLLKPELDSFHVGSRGLGET